MIYFSFVPSLYTLDNYWIYWRSWHAMTLFWWLLSLLVFYHLCALPTPWPCLETEYQRWHYWRTWYWHRNLYSPFNVIRERQYWRAIPLIWVIPDYCPRLVKAILRDGNKKSWLRECLVWKLIPKVETARSLQAGTFYSSRLTSSWTFSTCRWKCHWKQYSCCSIVTNFISVWWTVVYHLARMLNVASFWTVLMTNLDKTSTLVLSRTRNKLGTRIIVLDYNITVRDCLVQTARNTIGSVSWSASSRNY